MQPDVVITFKTNRGEIPLSAKDLRRFWSRCEKRENGCWIYSKTYPNGYGSFTKTINKIPFGISAHRLSWALSNGAIPIGFEICHNCPTGDNPSCINPDHLWAGTSSQNNADMRAKGRAVIKRGDESPRHTLKSYDIPKIRRRYLDGGTSFAKIAKEFNVGRNAIRKVVNRVTWKHLA